MQILPETAAQIAGESGGVTFVAADLEDPRVNIRYGSYYLRHALDAYDGDVRAARRVVQRRAWARSPSGARPRRPRGTRCASATSRTRRRGPT